MRALKKQRYDFVIGLWSQLLMIIPDIMFVKMPQTKVAVALMTGNS